MPEGVDEKLPTVGILGGTGPQGRGLGLRLALAGYEVVLGSRSPERAAATARGLCDEHDVADGPLTGGGNHEAAARDIVIVAVPFEGVRALLEPVGDMLAGTLLISCVNRMGFDRAGPYPIPVSEGSAAELIATLAPSADVYGAFHHVPAGRLTRDLDPLDMDVLVTGDGVHPDVRDLVESIDGVRAVQAGPLRLSRPLEELTAVIIAVNRRYKVTSGVRLTGLPDGS